MSDLCIRAERRSSKLQCWSGLPLPHPVLSWLTHQQPRKDQATLLQWQKESPTKPFGQLIRSMVLRRQDTEAPVALYRTAWNLPTIFKPHSFVSFPLPSFRLPPVTSIPPSFSSSFSKALFLPVITPLLPGINTSLAPLGSPYTLLTHF